MLTLCSRFRSIPFFSASFRLLLFRFRLLSLCFFLSSFFPLPSHSNFHSAASLPSGFLAFPFPLHPVSRVLLPFLRTRLSVSFLSSLPVSLPQLFPRCFPFAFAFGLSPSALLSFVRFALVLTTQPSVFLFPSSRFPLSAVPPVLPFCLAASLLFLFRPACFRAFLPILVLCFLQFLSPTLARPTELPQRPGLPLRALAVPLCLRFRFGYSASGFCLPAFFLCCPS